MLDAAAFLFPAELEVVETKLRNVLIIGSCLSEAYVQHFRQHSPGTNYIHILLNAAALLPPLAADVLAGLDLQYIQLPLRSVLTDAAVRIYDNDHRAEPIDWLALGQANIDRLLDAAMGYNRQYGVLTLVSAFVVPQNDVAASLHDAYTDADLRWVVSGLNAYLARRVRDFTNCYLADVDMIAGSLGRHFFLDDFISFHAHGSMHYPDWSETGRIEAVPPFAALHENRTAEFCAAVFRQMEHLYRVHHQIDQVKVVIFDLDNTLWRGNLAEDYGPEGSKPHTHGWPLGLWEAVHHLRRRGIVTAIVSKNDEQAVIDGWDSVVDPPFLKLEDFVLRRINWRPKAENIASILDALSLTAKNAVFVDDHPVERAAVQAALPQIRVLGANPYLTRRILLWSAETRIAQRSEESRRREQMLGQQIRRDTERQAQPRDAFLADLQTRLTVQELSAITDPAFARVKELVNKTSQFNTTGQHWDVPDYLTFWQRGGRCFAFWVADRFVEYGLVGVIFTDGATIHQYVMSCRVLGMEIELAGLVAVLTRLRADGAGEIAASVVVSPANLPCRDVYQRAGFVQPVPDRPAFRLPADVQPRYPAHVQVAPWPATTLTAAA